ncbi:DUF4157 domain-containing protein [Cellulomonas sp. DKR-3]|uniref:DUF4157 domain-containing protein n=1 Tax=Cellulomonas fulva TaxID=2835530 RepID=A0ABS5TWR0_9CELL|nr:DUF4157 domain-containing protein [Cellulomonas fulva]MBT0993553.1 DUF4157 domain-containing protein [Cellulomonas fulva]
MTRHAQTAHAHAPEAEAPVATAAPPGTAPPLHPAALTGLTVGHVDDPAEAAAESRATSVLARLRRYSGGPGGSAGSRSASQPAEVGRAGGAVAADRSSQITSMLGRGAPLAPDVRSRMEAGFGTSLDHVRVHDGPAAARHSDALGANAFTVGSDVFLGSGIDPGDPRGEHVLAHELAHVVAEPGGSHARRDPKDGEPKELTASEIAAGALTGKKNFSLDGVASTAVADAAGLLWTGLTADPGGDQWTSADGTKRYRRPKFKPNQGKKQANYESLPPANPRGFWKRNAHLDITD